MKSKLNARQAFFPFLIVSFFLSFSPPVLADSHKILIAEFMAINNSTLQDEDGDYSDWIELYNPGETAVNLNGWYLTDKSDNLTKWEIPAVTLNADSYLVIFASEKKRNDPSQNLHTNFKLSGSGEYLALVEPDGTTVSYSFGELYPAQKEDQSYGIYLGQQIFFENPTPGQENGLGNQIVAPVFSKERGFYNTPFEVSLSVVGNNLQIYYTTDGTRPSKTKGTLYTGPIQIQKTTPLSAVAVNASNVNSEVISHTYFFVNDIVSQSNKPSGYPSEWGAFKNKSGNAPADYEMDPEVVNHADYKDLMDDALMAVPTLSVVTDPGNFFSDSTDPEKGGIYIYTGNSGDGSLGDGWERPVSVEYVDPATDKNFQLNCGLRLHGGESRVPDKSPKHSFRLSFRSSYGPSRLNFNLFDEKKAANDFNSLVLRAGYNYAWTKAEYNQSTDKEQRERAQYLRDPFAKTTQQDMGQLSAHERFVHLYLNGIYWGVYNLSEKLTNDFMESYLGGDEDDFDVIRDHDEMEDGNIDAWNRMLSQVNAGVASVASYQKLQGNNSNGTPNPSYEDLLDVENLIDYMLLNFYIGNEDWDHHNWFAGRNRENNKSGFKFFSWDAETSMVDLNRNDVEENNQGNPSWIYQKLRDNSEFRLLFADHVQKHFFNEGMLTPDACINRYNQLADEIDLAIIAESARWGDYRKDVDPQDDARILYTRNDYWRVEKENLINNYFPNRSDIVVQQLRDAGLFPAIDAPVFSQFGGIFDHPITLTMNSGIGEIYYTTDNSDPRVSVTGAIASNAKLFRESVQLAGSVTVKARTKYGSQWSALTEADFTIENTTGINDQPALAAIVSGSFPNPFRDKTNLFYTLPEAGKVHISIHRADGRVVDDLFNGYQSPGRHEIEWKPGSISKGIYIYCLKIDDQCCWGKLIFN